jgi:hypothetical protein
VILGDPRTKRLATILIVVGFVLAGTNGAFAMALATGHVDAGGAELFSIIFGFVLAVAFVSAGVYIRGKAIARERSLVR